MKPTVEGLSGYSGVATTVTVANGQTLTSPERGSVSSPTSLGGQVTLTDTLLVPGTSTNLFSVCAADRAGAEIRFYNSTATVKKNGVVMAVGHVNKDEQYEMTLARTATSEELSTPHTAHVAYGKGNAHGDLWLRRFGHLGYLKVGKAAQIVTGMTISAEDIKPNAGAVCEPCIEARMQKHPPGAGERATVTLEQLCVDLIGPLTPVSSGGASHALSVTDACTDMSFVSPLKTKAEAGAALRDWILYLENQTNKQVKIIRTDGAKEILNNDVMRQCMACKGIKAEFSAPYSPK